MIKGFLTHQWIPYHQSQTSAFCPYTCVTIFVTHQRSLHTSLPLLMDTQFPNTPCFLWSHTLIMLDSILFPRRCRNVFNAHHERRVLRFPSPVLQSLGNMATIQHQCKVRSKCYLSNRTKYHLSKLIKYATLFWKLYDPADRTSPSCLFTVVPSSHNKYMHSSLQNAIFLQQSEQASSLYVTIWKMQVIFWGHQNYCSGH